MYYIILTYFRKIQLVECNASYNIKLFLHQFRILLSFLQQYNIIINLLLVPNKNSFNTNHIYVECGHLICSTNNRGKHR